MCLLCCAALIPPMQEFERMERDRAEEAEVRAQAAELRQLKAAGLLGAVRSCASPRPQAYIPEELGVPKPFPAAFRPFKPTEPPAAVAATQHKAAAAAAQRAVARQELGGGGEAAGLSPGACRVACPGSASPGGGDGAVPLVAGVAVA